MTTPTGLVAVVEPDGTLLDSIGRGLAAEGLAAELFAAGESAAAWLETSQPQLAVLASDAPSVGGLELCRRLRARAPAVPIIVTVHESELEDPAFETCGANDLLPKPFPIKALLARVKALLRRAVPAGVAPLAWEDRPLSLGALTVDPLQLTAQWGGHDVALTVTEFFILHALVRRAGLVKTRDQLMQDAYPGRTSADRIIDDHIRRIRAKFEKQDPAFDALEGVHNAGYRYRTGPGTRRSA